MAALFPDKVCNFYVMKNHKDANNSITSEAEQRVGTDFEPLELQKFFDASFKNNQYFTWQN